MKQVSGIIHWGKTLEMCRDCDCRQSIHCHEIKPQSERKEKKQAKKIIDYASLSRRACSGESIPRVVQTSMPIPRTSRTMSRILSKPRFRPARSLQAAPIQKRVLPFSFAFLAASRTGSSSTSLEAVVGVEYFDD